MGKAILFLLWPMLSTGQTIGFIEVVHEKKNEPKIELSANKNGGTAVFNRTYRSGCVGTYQIRWTFSKDIGHLQPGETFDVTLQCASCSTPCGYKWGIADVMASNNVLSVPGYQEYTYNGNLGFVGKSGSNSGVFDWQPTQLSNTYTFKYQPKKSAKFTAIAFSLAGHRIYYMFGENAMPSSNAINCHTLFGLGKLVNSLELGAYEGYPWDWMDKTIDYALNHIEASNCLTGTYLKGLKSRMYRAVDTNVFYTEIRTYSQKLESEVTASCSACSSCAQ